VFELASALTEKGYSTKVSFGIARDAGWPEALGIFIGTSAGGGLIGAVVADSYNTAKKWARRMFKQRSESEPKCEVSAQKLTIYDSEGKPIITWEISYRGELETDYRKPDPDEPRSPPKLPDKRQLGLDRGFAVVIEVVQHLGAATALVSGDLSRP
jgi:hypothetical protein